MSHSTTAEPLTPGVGEGGIQTDDVDGVSIFAWGLISVLIVVATIFIAMALYNEVQSALDEERIVAPTYASADDAVTKQLGLLNGYAAPSADSTNYRIPIDRAKELVVKELSSQ